jgi:hypothetical protein
VQVTANRLFSLLLVGLSLLATGCPSETPPQGGPAPGKSPKASPGETAPLGSSSKPADLGPPPPQEIEAADVKVGERYLFLTEQGELRIRETWEVKGHEPKKEVRYDLYSVTEVKGAEPHKTGPTPKVLRLAFDEAPAPPGPPPVAEGQETIVVSGVSFECTIYRQDKTRRWISARFPRLIKVEQDGQPFRRLVEIEPPE